MASPIAISRSVTYHIFNRGNNRENLFREERNYFHFLELYLKYVAPYAETYAFCLLRNHFHLLLRFTSRLAIPSQQLANLFCAYAKAINLAYGRVGSLFQNPFGRVAVLTDPQFLAVVRYIHHNPQKHGFVDDFRDWPYASFNDLTSPEPTFLEKDLVLDRFGGLTEFIRFHEEINHLERPSTSWEVELKEAT